MNTTEKEWKKKNDYVNTFEDFINTKDKNDLAFPESDPYVKNLKETADFIRHLNPSKTYTVMADYDSDGICSATIMHKILVMLGVKDIRMRFPKRFSEGYGLSMKAVDECPENSILITVDNGIAAVDQVRAAKEKGITVVVTDHHMPREDGVIPDADMIIDPNAIFDGETYRNYCGAGIAFRIMKELFPDAYEQLAKMEVFAGIATVTDVMELKGDNRNLVRHAIRNIRSGHITAGLRAVLNEFNIENICEDDFGFSIGPAFNAAGRLEDDGARIVYNLVSKEYAQSAMEAVFFESELEEMAKNLIALNQKRQDLVLQAMDETVTIMKDHPAGKPVIIEMNVSSGIVGIIAGRLAEQFHAPAIVFSETGDILKGSGRTYGNVHLKHLLDETKEYLLGYGGHAGAAGLSIAPENLNCFRDAFNKAYMKAKPAETSDSSLTYDFEISVNEIPETVRMMERYAPYGQGNRKPIVLIRDFDLEPVNGTYHRIMGRNKDHVKVNGPNGISGLLFGQAEKYKADGLPKRLDVIGCLSENTFRGLTSPQVEIEDYHKHLDATASSKVFDFSDFLVG